MTVPPTANKNLDWPAHAGDVDGWDAPLNQNFENIDAALGGDTGLNVTAQAGVVTLSSSQYIPLIIGISGTLTANVNYQLPAGVGGFWFIHNGATGAFSVLFSSAGGGSVVLPPGFNVGVFCDGTNVGFQNTAPPAPAGSPGWIQYNDAGVLEGASGVTTDGVNLGVTGDVLLGGNLEITGTTTALEVEGNAQTPSVVVAFSATAMVLNCDLSNVFATVFTAPVTTAPVINNPNDGQTINWFITQDATGGRTMTWPSSFKWPGGSPGVLSTAANAVDLVVATYRTATGNFYASLLKGFA